MTETTDGSPKPGVKMAIFGVVALALGLLGLMVSAQFEPLEPPSTIPVVVSPSAGAGTTTTTFTFAGPVPTTVPGSSTTSAPPTAAALAIDQTQLDFGNSDDVRSVRVTNDGGQAAVWDATASTPAISVSPSSGTLGPDESVTLEVSLDRATAPEGDLGETIEIAWQEGSLSLGVGGSNNANPVLHNPRASPSTLKVNGGGACSPTQATVSVRVRDASPLSSVVVRWAGQETSMIDVGNEMWEGVIGPFGTAQQESIRIVAFDELGNAGGAAVTVDVTPCP